MPESKAAPISWSVTTHNHHEHSTDWYWALALVIVAGAAICVWLGNFLFALILILGGGAVGFLAARGPREHSVSLDHRGLTIDGTLHRWSGIESFWVEHETATPLLLITTTGIFMPRLMLELDSPSQAHEVEAHLEQYAQKVEQAPHVGEHIAQLLGL